MRDVTIERRSGDAQPFSLLDRMYVERGVTADWDRLHRFHYKAEGNLVGPHYWRCMLETEHGPQLVGVVVLCVPRLLLAQRHIMFPKLKPGVETKVTNVYRAKFINRNFNTCSRTVVDTLYRSVGVSYRMLNLACRMEGKRYTELASSMSKFNPFAMRAGFVFNEPTLAKMYDQGIVLMARYFDAHPADSEAILEEIETMPSGLRKKAIRDLKAFYYKHSATEKTGRKNNDGVEHVAGMATPELLKNINQLVFSSPMYGCYTNPDAGRELPARLPLSAFDWQRHDQPLDLSRLTNLQGESA
tara:strand:+ start:3021 stop:3923 length:903 start_codon:yes stop_codon:yes gene_type:complete